MHLTSGGDLRGRSFSRCTTVRSAPGGGSLGLMSEPVQHPEVDEAVRLHPDLEAFLTQETDVRLSPDESYARLQHILDGGAKQPEAPIQATR